MAWLVTHNGASPIAAGVIDFSVNFKVFDEGDGRVTISIIDCGSPLATPSATPSACHATPSASEQTQSDDEPTPSQCVPTVSGSIATHSQTVPTPSEEQSTPWACEASACQPTFGVPPSGERPTGDDPSGDQPTDFTSPLDPTVPTPSQCQATPSVSQETPSPPMCCWDCDCDFAEVATINHDCASDGDPAKGGPCDGDWTGTCVYKRHPGSACEYTAETCRSGASTWHYGFISHTCVDVG